VIAPANTGNLVINKTLVTARAQIIKGIRSKEINLVVREHKIVVRKLILPRIEETPAT
jgi:hypothetical protein